MVKIKTEIHDLAALRAACKELGLHFKENQTTAKHYGGADAKCSHAIGVSGTTWEIAVTRNDKTKAFELSSDEYGIDGRALVAAAGSGCSKLLQYYGVNKATRAAKSQGFNVSRKVKANGTIQLVCQQF